VAVVPDLFAGSAVNAVFPSRAVREQNAGQHQSDSAAVLVLQVISPGKLLVFAVLDPFVPAKFLQGPGQVIVPVQPLLTLGCIRKSEVEYHANNRLPGGIPQVNTQTRCLEFPQLDRTRCASAGWRYLSSGKNRKCENCDHRPNEQTNLHGLASDSNPEQI